MRKFLILLSVCALALSGWACGSDSEAAAAAESGETAASAPAQAEAPVEQAPIEEIAGSIDWPYVTVTADGMRSAHQAVSKGMPVREALEAAAPHVGIPKQAGQGTANWVIRDDAGGCVNFMIVAKDGRVDMATFDTFPAGSMGEAKCQNFGI